MTSSTTSPGLDEIDKAIVRALQQDGRIPYSQLGSQVGLSETAARQRVHRLTERGVMEIVAVTDPTKIGLPVQAMIGVNVEGDIVVVADALARFDQLEYVVMAAGRFDLLVEVICSDTDDLLRVVNEEIRGVTGVRATEILSYLKVVKQTYNWGTG